MSRVTAYARFDNGTVISAKRHTAKEAKQALYFTISYLKKHTPGLQLVDIYFKGNN